MNDIGAGWTTHESSKALSEMYGDAVERGIDVITGLAKLIDDPVEEVLAPATLGKIPVRGYVRKVGGINGDFEIAVLFPTASEDSVRVLTRGTSYQGAAKDCFVDQVARAMQWKATIELTDSL